ncbi:unnamed protein product [Adineta steineri]|uniref:Secreted protein n=1 Tax=Adineta steineri TaxID=433720 RepID=A0A819IF02_9BILA|nr:unnamed protein product [Adineta steineri]CAF3913763.1 unnamed protein product [Adineta steineri]
MQQSLVYLSLGLALLCVFTQALSLRQPEIDRQRRAVTEENQEQLNAEQDQAQGNKEVTQMTPSISTTASNDIKSEEDGKKNSFEDAPWYQQCKANMEFYSNQRKPEDKSENMPILSSGMALTHLVFKNHRGTNVELFKTQNGMGQEPQLVATLAPGQTHDEYLPDGWAGNFSNGAPGKNTLFEISIRTDDKNQIYYDLSNVDGSDGVMSVQAPDGSSLQSPKDAYQYPTDDTKTHGDGGQTGAYVIGFH